MPSTVRTVHYSPVLALLPSSPGAQYIMKETRLPAVTENIEPRGDEWESLSQSFETY